MTEAQKTEAAILKAKATAREKSPKIVQTTQTTDKIDKVEISEIPTKAPQEHKKTQEPKVDIKKYPFNVKLGKNKEVNFKPWTGKTKKKFKKLFQGVEELQDVDFKGIIQVLLRDNIDKSNIYLSEAEQQYITALLRKESIGDDYEFMSTCQHCEEAQTIKTSVSETIKFTQNNFPNVINEISYVDIDSDSTLTNSIESIMNADNYDGLTNEADIEMALHLQIQDDSPEKVLNFLDDLPLNKLQEIVDNISNNSSKLVMQVGKNCTKCSKKSTFIAEEIPGLFESLLV